MTQQTSSQVSAMTTVIFDFIVDFKRQNDGLSPTIQQIGDYVGIDSKSHVHWYLRRLESDGKIQVLRNSARGIIVKGGQLEMRPERLTS